MATPYLMRLLEGYGDFKNYTYHLIEAKDEQMVKYHYHYTMKFWGYRGANWGNKHALDSGESGYAELDLISELTQEEYSILDKFVTKWHKEASR